MDIDISSNLKILKGKQLFSIELKCKEIAAEWVMMHFEKFSQRIENVYQEICSYNVKSARRNNVKWEQIF